MEPTIVMTVITIACLIMSIVMHEVAHGYMANWLGDPTARLADRLTLNPFRHLDPIGSVLVPGFLYLSNAGLLFGWAKPVPYNPYNLKSQRWGEALVAIAGPGTNIMLALIFALIVRTGAGMGVPPAFLELSSYIVYINVLLACFNMIPIPPLDGSKVLAALLPYRLEMKYRELTAAIESYGIMATFGFIFIFVYLLWKPFSEVVYAIYSFLLG
jgi:Zn-dependent protease